MKRRLLKLLLLILAWLGLLAQPGGAFAQEAASYTANVEVLFKTAVELGGYKQACTVRRGGCPSPAVLLVPLPENVLGQFDWREPKWVAMNSEQLTPGSLDWNAILVHEFVHFLQWVTGKIGPHTGCKEAVTAEKEAYAATAAYYARFGVKKDYAEQLFGAMLLCAMMGEG